MPEPLRTTLLRSHQTFYCIWGHPQSYIEGDSEETKLRRERDRLKQEAARLEDEKRIAWRTAAAAERRVSAAKGQITKLRKRAAAGVCPCCNRQFVDLHRHMEAKHKGFASEAVDLDSPAGRAIN